MQSYFFSYIPSFFYILALGLTLIMPGEASAKSALSAADRLRLMSPHTTVSEGQSRVRSLYKSPSETDPFTGVVATIEGPWVVEDMIDCGLNVTSSGDSFVSGRIKRSQISLLASLDGVKSVALSRRHVLNNDKAREYTFVDPVHAGTDLPRAYDGKGVIVGLFDIGIDPYHINFLNPDGTTRVASLWHYVYDEPTDTIIEYSYPHLSPEVFVTDSVRKSHGTHVLGTITGSFSSPDMKDDLRGMAPGATPVVACGELYDESILQGVSRMSDYAKEHGLPCVINLSIGNKQGPHDLSDPFTAALDELAGRPGTTVVLSAGNWGNDSLSIVKQVTPDTPLRTRLTHLPYAPRAKEAGHICEGNIEVWSQDDTPFTMSVEIVAIDDINRPLVTFTPACDTITALISADFPEEIGEIGDTCYTNDLFSSLFTESFMAAMHSLSSGNNRYSAAMTLSLTLKKEFAGRYAAQVRITPEAQGKVYLYCTTTYNGGVSFTNGGSELLDKATVDGTISNLCAGVNSLSIGAYISRKSGYGSPVQRGSFSSYGVLCDGRTRPDIMAPGSAVWSSLSTPYRHSSSWSESVTRTVATATVDGTTYYWTSMEGTSMSAPVMTGVAALWLSANPYLTTEDIRRIAAATAITPPNESTDESMNHPEYWGSGRLNAYDGLKMVLSEQASILPPANDAEEQCIMLTPVADGVWEALAPSPIERIDVYSTGGTLIRTIYGHGDVALTADLSDLSNGLYIARVATASSSVTSKLLR